MQLIWLGSGVSIPYWQILLSRKDSIIWRASWRDWCLCTGELDETLFKFVNHQKMASFQCPGLVSGDNSDLWTAICMLTLCWNWYAWTCNRFNRYLWSSLLLLSNFLHLAAAQDMVAALTVYKYVSHSLYLPSLSLSDLTWNILCRRVLCARHIMKIYIGRQQLWSLRWLLFLYPFMLVCLPSLCWLVFLSIQGVLEAENLNTRGSPESLKSSVKQDGSRGTGNGYLQPSPSPPPPHP